MARKLSQWMTVAALSASVALSGCGGETDGAGPGDEASPERLNVVRPGKADNFYSESAKEYAVTGTTTIELEPEYAGASLEDRMARAQALVPYRQVVLSWFLNAWLVEKKRDDENPYGGFKALTKNGSWEDLNLREVDELTFAYDFRQEFAGPLDLLTMLPTTEDEEGRRGFDLIIGRISTEEMQRLEINNEWYRKAPWGSFKPDETDAERLTTVRMHVAPQARSSDAWFDYPRLIEDGVLDMDVHFGWDYHNAYHLVHSRSVYTSLVNQGFKSPVDRYEDYNRNAGPLTRDLLTPFGPVKVEIRLFWGAPETETDPDTDEGGRILENDMRQSFAERDVIVFSGHSGPFYGFALANWRKTSEGDLDDSEIPTLEMPADRYQVVLAEGCDTYALGQAFFLNPAKASREHIDIITTTSYSNASTANTVKDFLSAFVRTVDGDELLVPRLSELLKDLDNNSWWFTTMYGLHGIDNNPRRHPWADTDATCNACESDAQCGARGNRCVNMESGSACTFECTADDGCPAGFACEAAESGGWIRTRVCVPTGEVCQMPREDVVVPVSLKITEVVPNPASDLNGDGEINTRKDERVVITNTAEAPQDLTGYSLADNVGVRYVFPEGFVLQPGESVAIYGGGHADLGVLYATGNGLGLNNRGDKVRLLDPRGGITDELGWGRTTPGEPILP